MKVTFYSKENAEAFRSYLWQVPTVVTTYLEDCSVYFTLRNKNAKRFIIAEAVALSYKEMVD